MVLDHFHRPARSPVPSASRSPRVSPAVDCCAGAGRASPEHAAGKRDDRAFRAGRLIHRAHRLGRLAALLRRGNPAGVSDSQYVEPRHRRALRRTRLPCRALGILFRPRRSVWQAVGHRPKGLVDGIAWVPLLPSEAASGPDADVYGGAPFVPNIVRALSLVPDHVRVLRKWSDAHYVALRDLGARRAIDRPQIELVAARVSALNECFY
jgi:hypothetical protein